MADNGRQTLDIIFEGHAVRVSDMRRTCVATQDKCVGIRFDEPWLARDMIATIRFVSTGTD
jgi:hypothetical protein